MVKTLVCILLTSFSLFADLKEDALVLYNTAKNMEKHIDNQSHYVKFVKQYKVLPEGKVRDLYYSVALLGAQVHGRAEELAFFDKCLKEKSVIKDIHKYYHAKMNHKKCYTCLGKKRYTGICNTCLGKKTCGNKKCNNGKTVTLDRVNGKFTSVQKKCTSCDGSSNCVTCKGEGKVPKRCFRCDNNGMIFNKKKSLQDFRRLTVQFMMDLNREYKLTDNN